MDASEGFQAENGPAEIEKVRTVGIGQKLGLFALAGTLVLSAAVAPSSPAPQQLDKVGMTNLMRAAQTGNLKKVQELLKSGANPNARDDRGRTALMWDVTWTTYDVTMGGKEETHQEIAELLITAGARIDARDRKGQTVLIRAADWEHGRLAETLIRRGANVNIKDINGRSALTFTAWQGVDGWDVKNLLRAGAKQSMIDALLLQDRANARRLVETADLRERGPHNETALILAASLGDLEIVNRLLERGQTPNHFDERGFPALLYALGGHPTNNQGGERIWDEFGDKADRTPIVKTLIDHDANPDPKIAEYESVLGWAVHLHQDHVVDLLLQKGAKPRRHEWYVGGPMVEAVIREDVSLLKRLLGVIGRPRNPQDYFWSPLTVAMSRDHHEIALVELFLDQCKCVKDKRFWYSMMCTAAREATPEIARLLLSRGGAVNLEPIDGGISPLMLAAGFNSPDMVKMLLDARAKISAKDKDGKTALDYALKWKRTENIQLLKQYGAKE